MLLLCFVVAWLCFYCYCCCIVMLLLLLLLHCYVAIVIVVASCGSKACIQTTDNYNCRTNTDAHKLLEYSTSKKLNL